LYREHAADVRFIEVVERDGEEMNARDSQEDPGTMLGSFFRRRPTCPAPSWPPALAGGRRRQGHQQAWAAVVGYEADFTARTMPKVGALCEEYLEAYRPVEIARA
jgi:hypothetical protein